MSHISLQPIKKALNTLYEGYETNPIPIVRDGIIQRFEYCFELCWKVSKRVLSSAGIEVDSPKGVFREMANVGWIQAPELWMKFLKMRNLTSHLYNDEVASEIFEAIPEFMLESKKLLKILEQKVKE